MTWNHWVTSNMFWQSYIKQKINEVIGDSDSGFNDMLKSEYKENILLQIYKVFKNMKEKEFPKGFLKITVHVAIKNFQLEFLISILNTRCFINLSPLSLNKEYMK